MQWLMQITSASYSYLYFFHPQNHVFHDIVLCLPLILLIHSHSCISSSSFLACTLNQNSSKSSSCFSSIKWHCNIDSEYCLFNQIKNGSISNSTLEPSTFLMDYTCIYSKTCISGYLSYTTNYLNQPALMFPHWSS